MDQEIDRKTFLLRGGALFTAATLAARCADPGRLAGGGSDDPLENARAAGLRDPILLALNTGITAPNPHNTQAWKFRVLDPAAADLFVDTGRLLPATDPLTRQIHIGQGTFIEHAALGAAELGRGLAVEMFPEGYDAGSIGIKPVARLSLLADGTARPDPLYGAIARRATNRTVYAGPMVSAAEVKLIQALVGPPHCEISFVSDPVVLRRAGDLFFEALKIELTEAACAAENVRWMRYGDDEIYGLRDGINLPGNGITGPKRWVVETFFDKELNETALRSALDSIRAGIDSARGLGVLKTRANDFADHVKAGRDYARLQLALTVQGLVLQPYSSLLQERSEFRPTLEKLNVLFGVRSGEKIQMIVRMGRSEYRFFAPRRALGDFLVRG